VTESAVKDSTGGPLSSAESAIDRWLPVLLAVFVFCLAARPIADPDVWFHVRKGQAALAAFGSQSLHPLPVAVESGRSGDVMYDGWLGQIILFKVMNYAGPGGLLAFVSLIFVGTYLLVFKTLRNWLSVSGSVLLTSLAAMAGQNRWTTRLEVFSNLLLALLLFQINRPPVSCLRLVTRVTPIFAFWANLHGAFALGYALLGIRVLEEVFETRALDGPWVRVGIAAGFAGWLNPHGFNAQWNVLVGYAGHSYIYTTVMEWSSPSFRAEPWLEAWILLSVGTLWISRSQRRWTDLVTLLAGLHMVLGAVRHMVLFGIMTAPILARKIEGIPAPAFVPARVQRWGRAVVLGMLLCLVLVKAGPASRAIGKRPIRWDLFPAQAVMFLNGTHVPGKMFNTNGWGYFLTYYLRPDYQVYIDGTGESYPESFHRNYNKIVGMAPGWHEELIGQDINFMVLPNDCDLSRALLAREDWTLIHADPLSVIFLRQIPKNGALIDSLKMKGIVELPDDPRADIDHTPVPGPRTSGVRTGVRRISSP